MLVLLEVWSYETCPSKFAKGISNGETDILYLSLDCPLDKRIAGRGFTEIRLLVR